MLHRPGNELRRLTPRNNDALLFDGIPWVDRAQDEHDAFADALRSRGVEVLYLQRAADRDAGRRRARARPGHRPDADRPAARRPAAPPTCATSWPGSAPSDLAEVLMAGLRNDEVRATGLVTALLRARGLPDRPAAQPVVHPRLERLGRRPGHDHLAGHAGPAARDPADRADLHLPSPLRRRRPDPRLGEGAPRGRRRAGAGRRGAGRRRRRADHAGRRGAAARTVFDLGLAHTMLAVPIDQDRATMHLDTICTMVDVDAVVMYPNVAHRLTAFPVTAGRRPASSSIGEPQPVPRRRRGGDGHRPAAADRHRARPGHRRARAVGRRQQHPWPSRPKLAVAYERNTETNARLEPKRASRSSRSPGPSSARAAAARAACPARSHATEVLARVRLTGELGSGARRLRASGSRPVEDEHGPGPRRPGRGSRW